MARLLTSMPGFAFLIFVAALPLGPVTERVFFPVASPLEITHQEEVPDGVAVYVSFTKNRGCKYVGLIGYQNYDLIHIDTGGTAISRPAGLQETGPWLIKTDTLTGLEVFVEHRCHFAWNTFTQLYPRGNLLLPNGIFSLIKLVVGQGDDQ